MDLRGLRITWLGHGTFRIDSPQNTSLLVDAWVDTNPACPPSQHQLGKLDAILLTHGHGDHIGDVLPVITRTQPAQVVGNFELCDWLEGKKVTNLVGMNKGGTITAAGASVTMVHADHSSAISDGDRLIYGGEAGGYVIRFPEAPVIYAAGDTNIFGDMRLIAELYEPEIAILPIGDFYTMGPREAALAAKLLGVKAVIPGHFGTFPVLSGTPAALRDELQRIGLAGVEVLAVEPGQVIR
ncbi:MAG TPA: metal-dependent hydrolase [Ktedonobacterales bacterium]